MATKRLSWFTRIARAASHAAGRPGTFIVAVTIILLWAFTGPVFQFSNTWQLVINTFTTITTFLMVFLIQSTQNRDTEALQIKMDELIRSLKSAHNELLDLEDLEDEELDMIRADYVRLARKARAKLKRDKADTSAPKTSDAIQKENET